MHTTTFLSTLALSAVALARTDFSGCTSTTVGYSVTYYVPGTGEICESLDCGGGRAPPKYNVPGCAQYTGTASYTPKYLTSSSTSVVTATTTTSSTATQVVTTTTTMPVMTETSTTTTPVTTATTTSATTDSISFTTITTSASFTSLITTIPGTTLVTTGVENGTFVVPVPPSTVTDSTSTSDTDSASTSTSATQTAVPTGGAAGVMANSFLGLAGAAVVGFAML